MGEVTTVNIDITNVLAGTALFIAGIFIGNGFSHPVESNLSASEIISIIGIAVTILIGKMALYTWKHQFT